MKVREALSETHVIFFDSTNRCVTKLLTTIFDYRSWQLFDENAAILFLPTKP